MAGRKLKNIKTLGPDVSIQDHILNCYLSLSYEIGITNLSIQKLAERSELSFGTIRNYLNEKGKTLELEAIKHVLKTGYEFTDVQLSKKRGQDKFQPIYAYFEVMYDWYRLHPEQASYLVYFYYLGMTNYPGGLNGHIVFEKAWLRLEGLLNESIGKGFYKNVAKKAKLVHDLHFLLMGNWIYQGVLPKQRNCHLKTLKEIKVSADRMIHSMEISKGVVSR